MKKEAIGTENEQGMIISQATHYALMEYMKQYYFAKTAGQMLAEMRYTKEITFWSTVISAPAVALGSLWTKAHREASNKLSQEAVKFSWKQWIVASAVGATYGAAQEVLEELMVDPIIEEWIRYQGEEKWGWNPELIYWVSTMATSARESMGFGIAEHYMESAVSFMQKKAGIQVDEKLQLELKAKIAERTGLDEKSQEFQKIFSEEMSKAQQANLEKMAKFEKGKNIALAIGLGTLGILAPDLFLSGLNAFVGVAVAERAYKSVSIYLKASRIGRITKRVKAVFYKDANVNSKIIEDKLEKTVSTIVSTDIHGAFNLDPKNSYYYFIKEITSGMNSLEAYGYQIQFEGDSKLKNLVYKELRERVASRIQLEFELMSEEIRSLKKMLEEARDLKRVKEQHDNIVKLAKDISKGMVKVKVNFDNPDIIKDDPRIAYFEMSYKKEKSGRNKNIANLRNVLDIAIPLNLPLNQLYDYIQTHVFRKLGISHRIPRDSVKVILYETDINRRNRGSNYITVQGKQFNLRTTTIGDLFEKLEYDTNFPHDIISVVIDPNNRVNANQKRFTTRGVYEALASLYTALKRVFNIGRIFNGRGNAEFFFGTTEGGEVITDVLKNIIDPAKKEMKSHLQKKKKGQLEYDKKKIKKLLRGWFKSCVNNDFMDELFKKFGGTRKNKKAFNKQLYSGKNSYFDQRYGDILDEIFVDKEKRDQFIIDFEKYLDEFLVLQLLTSLKVNRYLPPLDIKNKLINQLKNIVKNSNDPLLNEFNEKAANGVFLQQFFHYFAQIFEEQSNTLFPTYFEHPNGLQGATGERDAMAKYAMPILFYAYYKSGFNEEFLKSTEFFHSIQLLSHAKNMEEFIKLLDKDVDRFKHLKVLKNNGFEIPEPRELETMRVFPDIFMSYSEYMEGGKTHLLFNSNEVKTYSNVLRPSEIEKTIAQLTGGTVDVRILMTLKKYEESGDKDFHITAREHVFVPLDENGIAAVKNGQWKLRKRGDFVSPAGSKMGELNEFFIEEFANGLNDLISMYSTAENKKSLPEIKNFLQNIHAAIINNNYEGTPIEIYVNEVKENFNQAVKIAYSKKIGYDKF
ncbi:MAG: hypothetical protein ACTSVI_00330, partial [Promethearchaeota archaeon]